MKDILVVQINAGLGYYFYTASPHILPLIVNYNQYSISTILAFKDIESIPGSRSTIDTSNGISMFVTLESKSYKFREFELRL